MNLVIPKNVTKMSQKCHRKLGFIKTSYTFAAAYENNIYI